MVLLVNILVEVLVLARAVLTLGREADGKILCAELHSPLRLLTFIAEFLSDFDGKWTFLRSFIRSPGTIYYNCRRIMVAGPLIELTDL